MDQLATISMILPTRQRLAQAALALDSAATLAAHPERLEVVLYTDADDEPSRSIDHPKLKFVRLVGGREKMGEITQRCYGASTGQYVMLANDDIVFQTAGWDDMVCQAFARFGDDIALVWGNDLCSDGPVHPFLSRKMCELMGHICPSEYHREYIDTHLYDLFLLLRKLGHDRMVYLRDMVIEHRHVLAGKAADDATYTKPQRIDDEWRYYAWSEERHRTARQLARFIESSQQPIGAK